MRTALIFTIGIFIPCCLSSQPEILDVWKQFVQGQYSPETGNPIKEILLENPNKRETEIIAKSALIRAYGYFYRRDQNPTFLDSAIVVMEGIKKRLEPWNKPKWRGDDEYWMKWQELRKKMSDCIYWQTEREAQNRLTGDVTALVSVAELKLEEKLKRLMNLNVETTQPDGGLEPVKVTSKVINNGLGAAFTVEIMFSQVKLENGDISPGALGIDDLYKAIPVWFRSEVLAPFGINPESVKGDLKIEANGHVDGLVVSHDLKYTDIGIQKGQNYLYVTPDGSRYSRTLEIPIDNIIPLSDRSNEYLALSRAWIAGTELNGLTSNIVYVATEHTEVGGQYRKVTITLFGETLFRDYAKKVQDEMKAKYQQSMDRVNSLGSK